MNVDSHMDDGLDIRCGEEEIVGRVVGMPGSSISI